MELAEHAHAFYFASYDHATVEACDRHVVARVRWGDVPFYVDNVGPFHR